MTKVPPLELLDREQRGPFQVCFLVADLEPAVRQFAPLTGMPFDFYETTDITHPTLRRDGEPTQVKLRYALSRSLPQVELIEPLPGPSIYADHIAEHGYGFHHIAYLVQDMQSTRERFADAGFAPPIFEGDGLGVTGDGSFSYYDTRAQLGCYLELIRPPAERYPPLSTFSVAR
jgi:hypothetical protein